jgi:hypothetical protein
MSFFGDPVKPEISNSEKACENGEKPVDQLVWVGGL